MADNLAKPVGFPLAMTRETLRRLSEVTDADVERARQAFRKAPKQLRKLLRDAERNRKERP